MRGRDYLGTFSETVGRIGYYEAIQGCVRFIEIRRCW